MSRAAARLETKPLETEAIQVRKQHLAVGKVSISRMNGIRDTCGKADLL